MLEWNESGTLDRFLTAQSGKDGGFALAQAELKAGEKQSHWIWYIFPQLEVLGRSSTARYYGIKDLAEARSYLAHSVLGARLARLTAIVENHLTQGHQLVRLMGGSVDALKLVSSLTLFEVAAASLGPEPAIREFFLRCGRILATAAAQGIPRCQTTLATVALLKKEGPI